MSSPDTAKPATEIGEPASEIELLGGGLGSANIPSSAGAQRFGASNRLVVLADEINRAHGGVRQAAREATSRAIDAGGALLEAKALLEHGEWLPWLREHCAVSERTARLYMRLAANRDQIGNVADLSLRGAIALITVPKSLVADHARLAADLAADDVDALFEKCQIERRARAEAFTATALLIEKLKCAAASGTETPAAIELGEQLVSTLNACNDLLRSTLKKPPLTPEPGATALAIRAKNLAAKLLELLGGAA